MRNGAQIAAIRRFNRFYTRRIALLEKTVLDSPFTLAQARVLFELGQSRRLSAADLVATLDLDAGYLSRILQGFARRHLLCRERTAKDGRRATLRLTVTGRKALQELDRRSARMISRMIEPLSSARRSHLIGSMQAVERYLSEPEARTPRRMSIRPYRIGDIGWAIERHATLYAQEFGWNEEFETLVAGLFARFAGSHDSRRERFWVAEVDGERRGCVFLVRSDRDPDAAQLRCLLVDPNARGLGLGRRLVDECLGFAISAGYAKMVLWTNDVLTSARRIYVAAGFEMIEESPHRSFGHDLVGQVWARAL